jgi:hypothetical protein
MASGNSPAAPIASGAGIEMPRGEMGAPPGPSVDMPSGGMPGEEVGAFTPATGDMPRREMGEPNGGVLAGLMTGIEAAALSEMPRGDMGRTEAAAAAREPTIEISGSWTLHLTSSIFKSEVSR